MYNHKDKSSNVRKLNDYMFNRTLSMFDYDGLPETIPAVELEKKLQRDGFVFITEIKGDLYALTGGLGGEPDEYDRPTTITISNPALKFHETLKIGEDGILILNDDMKMGLLPLYDRYNSLLIENEITMFIHSYNTRIQTLISAGDDATRESAELYLKKVVDGEMGIIGENRIFEGIKVQATPYGTGGLTTQLIEFNQYIKANLYNEVGLNANFNMKRERLNSGEVEMNTDNLRPLVDNMLKNREKGFEAVNDLFGTEITVEFGSIWKVREVTDSEPLELIEPEEPIEEPINEPEPEPEEPDEVEDEPDDDLQSMGGE